MLEETDLQQSLLGTFVITKCVFASGPPQQGFPIRGLLVVFFKILFYIAKQFYDFTIKYSWKCMALMKLISQIEPFELLSSFLLIGNAQRFQARKSFTRFLVILRRIYIVVNKSGINLEHPTGSYMPLKVNFCIHSGVTSHLQVIDS